MSGAACKAAWAQVPSHILKVGNALHFYTCHSSSSFEISQGPCLDVVRTLLPIDGQTVETLPPRAASWAKPWRGVRVLPLKHFLQEAQQLQGTQ